MKNSDIGRGGLGKLRRAAEGMHDGDKTYKRATDPEFYIYVITVIVIVLAIRLFIFEPVLVSGDSMYDTLENGERMFVEKVSYWVEPPQHGDIIICYYPNHVQSCVKRVIACAGDKIYIYDGAVYVNGEKIDESAYWDGYMEGSMYETTVPDGCVFVMGDNRNESGDSRRSDVGPIPYYRVSGKVLAVIWPLSKLRGV